MAMSDWCLEPDIASNTNLVSGVEVKSTEDCLQSSKLAEEEPSSLSLAADLIVLPVFTFRDKEPTLPPNMW